MRQRLSSTGAGNVVFGACLGVLIMGIANWVWGESKPVEKNPIGDKFWPSEFGAEDQRGAANRVTPQKTLEAARLITTGRVFQLGRLYEQGMPVPGKRHFSLTIPESRLFSTASERATRTPPRPHRGRAPA